jgi:molybdenum cofactor guanylyltransferase
VARRDDTTVHGTPGAGGTTPVIAGAILTGGSSRRMGRDKALLVVRGRPMAVHVAEVLALAGVADVVAVGGAVGDLARLGLSTIVEEEPGCGPLGGLRAALAHFDGSARQVVVVACDLPRLDPATVAHLIDMATADPGSSDVVVASSGRLEPLCAVWSIESCRPVIDAAFVGGERSVLAVLSQLRVAMVEVSAVPLLNANRPDDLAGL